VELVRDEDKLAWLMRQGEAHGFRIVGDASHPAVDVRSTDKLTGHRTSSAGGKDVITVGAALFEGVLEVTDPTRFREAVEQGIGRARAYGCGLLSIARAG
jgi:CRISPR system Cascade subunit CasE